MNDREVILDVLRRVARRLSLNRALQEIAFAAAVVLFALAVLELVRPAAPVLPVAGMLLLGLACLGAYALWRASRRASLAQAAGAADSGAKLRDELKTACWFLSQNETTPFVEVQVARAARSAQAIEPARLVPLRPQRGAFAVAGLAVLLFASAWVTPRLSHSWETLARADRPAADAAAMRARLDELRGPEAQRVAQALAVLERQDAGGEERQRAAREVRDAAAQADMRAAAARETLERLAAALEGRGELARVLQQGRAGEAARLLRDELRRSAAAEGHDRAPARPQDALEQLLREIAGGGMENDREVQQRTLRAIEDAEQALQAQQEIREIERQMQDFYAISAQRSPYSPGEPDASPPPEAGHVELHSGGTSQMGARLRLEDDESLQEGSGVGAGYGESPAMALEGAPSARLDVELQLETVQVRSEGGGDAGGDAWYFAPSREQAAQTGFAAIGERGMHARAETVGASGIPLRQRGLVRDYFINLHESQKP